MLKEEISFILEKIATLLELNAENPFKIRAYNAAAHAIANLNDDLKTVIDANKIKEIEGIGEAIAAKIMEYSETGSIGFYNKLKEETPPGLLEMLRIPKLGPKKIHALYKSLGIKSIEELENACLKNQLKDLAGFGVKTQANILKGIALVKANQGKHLYPEVANIAQKLLENLRPFATQIAIAGSLRRFKELVKDIDIVATSRNNNALLDAFVNNAFAKEVIQKGDNKASIITSVGINADLLIVEEEEYPYALHHFTGSKEHNIAMRSLAKTQGLKINEFGVFKDEIRIPAGNEEEFFKIFGLSFIPPELREDTGEIEAAMQGSIPDLITEGDIQGLFHVHTAFSDGLANLRQMRDAAKAMGFKYLGISDHSQTAAYAGGLKLDTLIRQAEEIDILNGEDKEFTLLKGIESDILPDGNLDYPEEVLNKFDFVIGSIHSRFNMTEIEMTARIVKALQNKYLTILGHPTGRLLLAREAYPINLEEILQVAALNGKCIEINSSPHRLDLDWHGCRRAKELGIKIAISPDAHTVGELRSYLYGVKVARKAWLTKNEVLNAMPIQELLKYLQKS